jgi:hypothetical protein
MNRASYFIPVPKTARLHRVIATLKKSFLFFETIATLGNDQGINLLKQHQP